MGHEVSLSGGAAGDVVRPSSSVPGPRSGEKEGSVGFVIVSFVLCYFAVSIFSAAFIVVVVIFVCFQ